MNESKEELNIKERENEELKDDKIGLGIVSYVTISFPLLISIYYLFTTAYTVYGPIIRADKVTTSNSTCSYTDLIKANDGKSTISVTEFRGFPTIVFVPAVIYLINITLKLLTMYKLSVQSIKLQGMILNRGSGGSVAVGLILILFFILQSIYNSISVEDEPTKTVICKGDEYVLKSDPRLDDNGYQAALSVTLILAFVGFMFSLVKDSYSKLSMTNLSPCKYTISRYYLRTVKFDISFNTWRVYNEFKNANKIDFKADENVTEISEDDRMHFTYYYLYYGVGPENKKSWKLFWWIDDRSSESVVSNIIGRDR